MLSSGPPEAPGNLTITSITADSVTITWLSGLDGGHPQSFSILTHSAGGGDFTPSDTDVRINDTGRSQLMQHTVSGLQPRTHYDFKVSASNVKGTTPTYNSVTAVTLGE